MKKFIKCAVLSVLMVCSIIFSLPLTASAVESYTLNINEPAKGDNQGYILLYVESLTGSRSVICINWTLFPSSTNPDLTYYPTDMLITIENNTVSFGGRCPSASYLAAGFGRCLSGDNNRNLYWTAYQDTDYVTYVYDALGTNKIIGFQIYGNGRLSSHDIGYNANQSFNVVWGSDGSTSSILTKMLAELYINSENNQTIISQLNELLGHAQTSEELLVSIDYWINACNDKLQDIRLRVRDIRDLLEQIVNAKGESTFEEPDTGAVDDYNKAEGELVNGADDTADIEGQIGSFEIDANASGTIWDIITQFINSHPKVFGLVIGILCLGIIALILNR